MRSIAAVIIDTFQHKPITQLALRRTLSLPNCGQLYTLSDQPLVTGASHHPIAPIRSLSEYSDIVLRVLPEIVREDHFLLIQWDGMPVSAGAWEESFLDFDYIGAPWEGLPDSIAVGNGGFSLRSRKLIDATKSLKIDRRRDAAPNQAEDVMICREHRASLELKGIRFAPVSVARRFSFETGNPPPSCFGFHSTFNFPLFFREDELLEFAGDIVERQSNVVILAIYLHRLIYCRMHELLTLSIAAIHARPGLAASIEAQTRSLPIHNQIMRILWNPQSR